jgi:hypothetical protein
MNKINNVDYRTRVGTDTWNKRHDEDVKKNLAWRRLHALLPHDEVMKRANQGDDSARLVEVVKEVEKEQKKK